MRVRGVTLVVIASVAALALVGLGLRSFGIAESNGVASPVAEILAFVLGVWLPLFALIYACVRSRVAVVVLAFCVGLSVNLVFLTHATPAAAVTDNSSVFTFQSTTPASAYVAGYQNMIQNYSPTSGTATTCPPAAGANWMCTFNSDSFSAGQSVPGGSTAQADLYLENTNKVAFVGTTKSAIQNVASTSLNKPAGLHTNDVMLASFAVRGGTGTTVTAPDATWNALARVDDDITISIVTFWHAVTNAASEPASYTFTFNGNVKGGAGLVAYSGVDNATPIDQETGQTTPSGTSHTALSVTTGAANTMLVTMHGVAAYACCLFAGWTPPAAMTERVDTGSNTGSSASNADFEINDLFIAALGTATGAQTATSIPSAVGLTKTITLKPPATARTCTVTAAVKKQSPIWLRSVATGESTTTALTLNQPAGTQQNDVLVMVVASTAGGTFTAPPEFTQFDWTSYLWAGWHVVGASDPGPYTFSWVSPQSMIGWMGSYVGVDTASPADPTHPKTSTSGTSHSTNTNTPMSTATQYEMLIAAFQIQADAAWTAPADMLEVADFNDSAAPFVTLGINHALQAQATTSIVKTATSSVSGSGTNLIFALKPSSSNTTSLGSTTVSISSPSGPTLVSTGPFALASTNFAAGDHLILDISVPDDPNNCPAVRVSYDSTGQPSKLTIATIVPEGVLGLLLLAPALPLGARWWKRRRP
jgi:hypothetical protein